MSQRDDPPQIADPTSHFPYHEDKARAALDFEGDGNEHPGALYLNEDIIRATAAYVTAQENALRNPGDGQAHQAEMAAAQELQAVRAFHRRHRKGPAIITGSVDQAVQAIDRNTVGG